MKISKLKFLVIWLFMLFGCFTFGQQNESSNKLSKSNNSYFSLNLSYSNDYVFMGRKDSITAPYLYFIAKYQHKSGFYADGSVSYLTKADEGRVDLFLFDLGYNFTVNKFSGDLSATKYFFNEESYNVLSEIDVNIAALISYDFDVVDLMLSASTYFGGSSNADFFLSTEISHDFMTSNRKFQFSPTFGIYFGSQNFYESYYINNRYGDGERPKSDPGNGSGSGSGNGTGTGTGSSSGSGSDSGIKTGSESETITEDVSQITTELVIEESEKFNLMAAELSLPMWYIHKSFAISFMPSLVFPFNEATIFVDDAIVNEDLKETFYWMVGCSYKF